MTTTSHQFPIDQVYNMISNSYKIRNIISCFPIGYLEISVKNIFRSDTGSTSENTYFHVLVA